MDMMDILVVLLRAGVVKVKLSVDLPDNFVKILEPMLLDKVIDEKELADLIDAFRGK